MAFPSTHTLLFGRFRLAWLLLPSLASPSHRFKWRFWWSDQQDRQELDRQNHRYSSLSRARRKANHKLNYSGLCPKLDISCKQRVRNGFACSPHRTYLRSKRKFAGLRRLASCLDAIEFRPSEDPTFNFANRNSRNHQVVSRLFEFWEARVPATCVSGIINRVFAETPEGRSNLFQKHWTKVGVEDLKLVKLTTAPASCAREGKSHLQEPPGEERYCNSFFRPNLQIVKTSKIQMKPQGWWRRKTGRRTPLLTYATSKRKSRFQST